MSTNHIWSAVILLFGLLLAPIVEFLCLGWGRRRSDVVDGFTDAAISSYFKVFHPRGPAVGLAGLWDQFNTYYCSQFGRKRFLLPVIFFALISGLVLCWIGISVPSLLETGTVSSGQLPVLCILAILGACMWILYDEITRWYAADLSPAAVYWWCFRLVIAVPMGYAVSEIFSEKVALPVVFLLGAFPTTQIISLARRLAVKTMKNSDSEGKEISELQSLQGIDVPIAESFTAEGITTILQLAYCDPIRMTIRTGLSYSFTVDCTCQALLWLYLEKDTPILRQSGLRSAFEVLDLCLDLESDNEQEKKDADQLIREAAAALKRPETSLKNILGQVALDPYTQFLYLSWSGITPAKLNDRQCKMLDLK